MADFSELIGIMKKASLDAVEAAKPAGIFFGTVVSASPLKINVEQKITLMKDQLVLARSVTGDDGLKDDERVILIRMQGGQKFIVIDRLGDME